MAREEIDREDIIREATALIRRAEFRVDFCSDVVTIGFRRDGSVSLFFGQDEVFQFNKHQQLRRAYFQCQLIKADCGQLVHIRRVREKDAVRLLTRPFTATETTELTNWIRTRLDQLTAAFSHGLKPVRFVWTEGDDLATVIQQITDWLAQLRSIAIAMSPRVSNPK